MNDRDKIAELEERVRQLKQMLCPPGEFPLEWHLTPSQTRMLATMSRTGSMSEEQLLMALGDATNYGDREEVSYGASRVQIAKLRVKVKSLGIEIHNSRGQGYYLGKASLQAVRAAFTAVPLVGK